MYIEFSMALRIKNTDGQKEKEKKKSYKDEGMHVQSSVMAGNIFSFFRCKKHENLSISSIIVDDEE